jgi:acetyl-CoA carboxylase carboxyltransferase component
VYDVKSVINTLADIDSLLELRPEFGVGIVTCLIRIEGKPMGIIANNPAHLGGAIDSDAADKASRFIQLCDAYDLPIVSLCDTPGFMVGPDAEHSAQVRHFGRMFVTAGSITVPWVTVVLRKGYGLGAMAMAGGGFHSNAMTVSWPTGEFGGMGLEGAVRLGYRKELESVEDPTERAALEEKLIARAYEHGSALNMASHFEIDDVIDPADTRRHILSVVGSTQSWRNRSHKKRPMVDAW